MFAEHDLWNVGKFAFLNFVSLGGATALRMIDLAKHVMDCAGERMDEARATSITIHPASFAVSRSAHLNRDSGPLA